jgi:hypothetical protein
MNLARTLGTNLNLGHSRLGETKRQWQKHGMHVEGDQTINRSQEQANRVARIATLLMTLKSSLEGLSLREEQEST